MPPKYKGVCELCGEKFCVGYPTCCQPPDVKKVLEKRKEDKRFDAWYKHQAERRAAELSRHPELETDRNT